jgi:predicted nucleic acid-binding protein
MCSGRHLTGDPPEMATRATEVLANSDELLLADLIVAECVNVLESFYEVDRLDFAEAYLVAQAEATGVDVILSFDKSIDRVATVTRHEP